MSVNVQFETIGIEITDEYFPPELAKADIKSEDGYTWKYSFSFQFSAYGEGYEKVCFSMSYDLHDKNETEDDSIAWLDIESSFKFTKAGVTNKVKATLLVTFLELTLGHIQGIYAVKVEKTSLAMVLPPPMNWEKYYDNLLKQIENGKF